MHQASMMNMTRCIVMMQRTRCNTSICIITTSRPIEPTMRLGGLRTKTVLIPYQTSLGGLRTKTILIPYDQRTTDFRGLHPAQPRDLYPSKGLDDTRGVRPYLFGQSFAKCPCSLHLKH